MRAPPKKLKIGPTGEYPRGKIHKDDEGELRLGIAVRGGKVVMAFGKPIAWLGFDPEHAENVANSLLEAAAKARGGTTA